jgi:hypothetical protein
MYTSYHRCSSGASVGPNAEASGSPALMHTVIAGATGTGKTVYMTSQINALDSSVYQNIQTAFSAQTSANQIQDIIDLKLDKRRKVQDAAMLLQACCAGLTRSWVASTQYAWDDLG